MGFKDLYPSKEDLEKAADPDYWRGRDIWFYLEQLLSLAFVVLALVHAFAIADYKMTIKEEFDQRGCRDILESGIDADLYNQSKLPDALNETTYQNLRGDEKQKPQLPEKLRRDFYRNSSSE